MKFYKSYGKQFQNTTGDLNKFTLLLQLVGALSPLRGRWWLTVWADSVLPWIFSGMESRGSEDVSSGKSHFQIFYFPNFLSNSEKRNCCFGVFSLSPITSFRAVYQASKHSLRFEWCFQKCMTEIVFILFPEATLRSWISSSEHTIFRHKKCQSLSVTLKSYVCVCVSLSVRSDTLRPHGL